jgi:hypothetical protein
MYWLPCCSLLQANGADIRGGTWFETGAEMLNGGTLNYFAVPWGIVSNPLPLFAVVAVEVALMGAVEAYRRNGTGPAGYSPGVGKFDASSECLQPYRRPQHPTTGSQQLLLLLIL